MPVFVPALLLSCGSPAKDASDGDVAPVETGAADTASDLATCPAPSFELMGSWDNVDLPATESMEGRDPGLGVVDLDRDGDEDVVYAWSGGVTTFVSDGRGVFTPGTLTVDGAPARRARAVAVDDLDADGDDDLVLGYDSPEPDRVLYNGGAGTFTSQVLLDSNDTTWSVSLADFDGDGNSDIYTATYAIPFDFELVMAGGAEGSGHAFWMRRPEGGWRRVAVPAAVDTAVSLQGAVLDANHDGHLDVYMVNDFGPYVLPTRLLTNDGRGNFSVATDCSCEVSNYAMGAGVGDANGDGHPDIFLTNIGWLSLLLNDGSGAFYDAGRSNLRVSPTPDRMTAWGALFVDADLDGDDDIVTAYGSLGPNGSPAIGQIAGTEADWTEQDAQYSTVFVNDGTGAFDVLPSERFPEFSRARVVVAADLDGDPHPDLVVAGRHGVRAWRGTGGCATSLAMELEGPAGNRGAFGARIDATVGGRTTTRWLLPSTTGSQSTRKVFVGLGGAAQVDRLVVTWPDGSRSEQVAVPAGRVRVRHGVADGRR